MTSTEKVGRLEFSRNKHILWHVTGVFNEQLEVDECWESPVFSAYDATWHLILHPNGREENNSAGYFGIFLQKDQPLTTTHFLHYTIILKNLDGTTYQYAEATHDFTEEDWGWKTFLKRSTLLQDKNDLTSDDELTIYLEMDNGGVQCTEDPPSPAVSKEDVDQFMSNIADTFLKQQHFDINIKVKDEEFQAHKFILSARSPVFASMFEHDMRESRSGSVIIEDCDPSAFKDVLNYLYTADVGVLTAERVYDLYFIADKYHVECLRLKCVRFMLKNLTPNNFCKLLTVALRHNDSVLMKEVDEFFFKNVKNVLETEEWQMFMKENGTAANKLFIKYSEQANALSKNG